MRELTNIHELEKILSDTFNEIREIYDELYAMKAESTEKVASLLKDISKINNNEQIKDLRQKYPHAEKQIELLAQLLFSDDVASKVKKILSKELKYQNKIVVPMADALDIAAPRTDKTSINIPNKNVTMHTATPEQIHVRFESREEWLNKTSKFKEEIKSIQQTIDRLNSFLVYKGRAKAAKLQEALNNAIDAGREGHFFKNFNAFLNYSKSDSSYRKNNLQMFRKNKPLSIQKILDEHRHEWWDKVIRKKTTRGLGKK